MTDTQQTISVQEATADLEAARDSLQDLTERIIEGGGTEADLEAAERRVRFFEARLEGARRHEHRQAEEERLQAFQDLAERTKELVAARRRGEGAQGRREGPGRLRSGVYGPQRGHRPGRRRAPFAGGTPAGICYLAGPRRPRGSGRR